MTVLFWRRLALVSYLFGFACIAAGVTWGVISGRGGVQFFLVILGVASVLISLLAVIQYMVHCDEEEMKEKND